MSRPLFVCIGGVFWDRVAEFRGNVFGQPGGSALNTALTISSLGEEVWIAGNRLGQDENATHINKVLDRPNIASFLYQDCIETPHIDIFLDGNGERTVSQSLLSARYVKGDLNKVIVAALESQRQIYAYVFVKRHMLEIIAKLRRKNVHVFSQDLKASECVPGIQHLQINYPEEMALTREGIKKFSAVYPSNTKLFITAGSRGVALVDNRAIDIFLPQTPEKIENTIGAGDSFRAGVMVAFSRGKDMKDAIHFGQNIGSRVLQKKEGFL